MRSATGLIVALILGTALAAVPDHVAAQQQGTGQQGQDDFQPPPAQGQGGGGGGGGQGIRLGMQGRLEGFNMLGSGVDQQLTPIATPGLRLLDHRLWIGLGVGLLSVTDGPTGFSLSPMVSYDVLTETFGALYVVGWLNLGDSDGTLAGNDSFFVGLNAGLGIRGEINEGLAIGSEWGWGFLVLPDGRDGPGPGGDDTEFRNGFFGTLFVEASIGI